MVAKAEEYLSKLDTFSDLLAAWRKAKETAELFGDETPAEPEPPVPPRLIVLGPGGTGKSFLIRVLVLIIRRWARNRSLTRPSSQQGVVLAAPTGVAAFNIGGSTIHKAFRLRVEKDGRSNYEKLTKVAKEDDGDVPEDPSCAALDLVQPPIHVR